MKILMVYPEYPDTFWSFKHALKFISKKAAFPPLGLLTVAAMLPQDFELKLIDMNMSKLKDKDIKWADLVFISAMVVQKESAKKTVKRCKKLGARIVAGGPLFTTQYQDFDCVDHLVLNEGEVTLPLFLEDLEKGCARHIYTSDERPDISSTPLPRWELVKMRKYSSMALQYSRGCPFDCEFCDIVVLNGRRPRTKDKEQVIRELEAIYNSGWRESVFVVDDNFIGNKKKLKAEILPAIIEWMQKKNNPFTFHTQTSINLADDDELIQLMVKANFDVVFIGIESPNEASLVECGKSQNKSEELIPAIKKLQHYGLEVQGGFILGFDSDTQSTFQEIINFIQKSGVVTAMVGLLHAPNGTRLYKRLKNENRLTGDFSGNNTDISINFVPKMKFDTLAAGYKKVVSTIYAPKPYYERITTFLKEYKPKPQRAARLKIMHYRALLRSFWVLGVRERGRMYFWKLLAWTVFTRPRLIALSVTLSIYGFHFRKIADSYARSLDLSTRVAP
ncbi:MAG: B12-binding domain-containing radical SAM protein [Chloroflexi bacterium]|nr:B12-binding domain-containing radical SAM protein [Chloroflexota bacterium]